MQQTAANHQNIDLSELEHSVLERITEKAWLDLTCELVPAGQPEAENPLDPDEAPAREEGAALFVAGKLEEMGFTVTMPTKREGRPNVIGVLDGPAGGRSLILNDHLDTYPAGDWASWTMTGGNPFRPTRYGDRLYARGTSDTRGNLACTLLAARAIREAGIVLNGTLKCVYTADEEKNGPDGSIFLLDECGLTADYTIVCEPTGWTQPDGSWGMGIAIANGGHFLVEIETRGETKIVEVRQYEAKRLDMNAADFDALVAGQTVAHPSFEQTLTADFLGTPGKELESRLMKHLQGIGAFLLAEKRIGALPADWAGLINTKPIQIYLGGRK